MSTENSPLQQLHDIRNMMERSSRFISLSGLSGVFAGIFALAGAAAFYAYVNQNYSYGYQSLVNEVPFNINWSFYQFCFIDAAIVLTGSLAAGIFFTTRRAKADGRPIWDRTALLLLTHLFIPLAAGGIFCLIMMWHGWFGLVAPALLLFYGMALLNASKFTLPEIQWLGISEIALGLLAFCFLGYGLTFWSIGFGILHIIYGLVMYVRYEAKPKEKRFW
ncbi:MAG: hypothetical protein U0T73_13090 [Chitinophagales bacterium]